MGENAISYLYTYERYCWEVKQASLYKTVTSTTSLLGTVVKRPVVHNWDSFYAIAGQLVFIPLLSALKVKEPYILMMVLTSNMARNILKGSAVYQWIFYMGNKPIYIVYYIVHSVNHTQADYCTTCRGSRGRRWRIHECSTQVHDCCLRPTGWAGESLLHYFNCRRVDPSLCAWNVFSCI